LKIEHGSYATEYETPEPRAEGARCEWYYQKISDTGLVPLSVADDQKTALVLTNHVKDTATVTVTGGFYREIGTDLLTYVTSTTSVCKGNRAILTFVLEDEEGSPTTSTDSAFFGLVAVGSSIELDARY
jgi:hypothetical protein